jgi:hypothetical protein
MLYSEIIAVCSQIHTKHINTRCGQNVEFCMVEPGGTYSYHWDLMGWLFSVDIAISLHCAVICCREGVEADM